MLLYDEIWFIGKHLCPYNMEHLPYVHFLNQEYDLRNIDLGPVIDNRNSVSEIIDQNPLGLDRRTLMDRYGEAIENNSDAGWKVDNHSRSSIQIGVRWYAGNPDEYNMLIDEFIAEQFGLELVTNTRTSPSSLISAGALTEQKLAHVLVIDEVPNILIEEGPHHPVVEEMRSDRFLRDFRSKVGGISANRSEEDVAALRVRMNKQMQTYTNELVLKALDPKRLYKGVADGIVGQVPIISNIYSAVDGMDAVYQAYRDKKSFGWIGFMARASEFGEDDNSV